MSSFSYVNNLYFLRLYRCRDGQCLCFGRNSAFVLKCHKKIIDLVSKYKQIYLVGSSDLVKFVIVCFEKSILQPIFTDDVYYDVKSVFNVEHGITDDIRFLMRQKKMDYWIFNHSVISDDLLRSLCDYVENHGCLFS